MDGIDHAEGPGGAREAGGARHVVDGAHGVGRVPEGDDLRLARRARCARTRPSPACRWRGRRGPRGRRRPLRQPQPRPAVGFVVERGDHDLVAGLQLAAERVGEEEVQRGHVGAEADLAPVAAEEVGAGAPRPVDDLVGLGAGGEAAVDVAVVAQQVAGHRIRHGLWRLRAAGGVEVGRRVAVHRPLEGRELAAHVGDVELGHGHLSDASGARSGRARGPSVPRRRAGRGRMRQDGKAWPVRETSTTRLTASSPSSASSGTAPPWPTCAPARGHCAAVWSG